MSDTSDMSEEKVTRVIKLVTGEVIFGEVKAVETLNGSEVLVKHPYTASGGNVFPYMVDVFGQAPGAVQIHPMNIVWSVPLDEFSNAAQIYSQAMGEIVTDAPKKDLIID